MIRTRLNVLSAGLLLLSLLPGTLWASPIRKHPRNPHWFEWRGKAVALITGAEHYGSVLNLDFDYRRYLETMQRDGMNYTRLFAGSYVEPQGAFGIEHNTLAPASGRFLAPWARSTSAGYAGGGNKFDLDHFSPEYLTRLKDFLTEADRRGIVVELTLFCATYGDRQWALHPLNPANNAQAPAVPQWKKLHTSENGAALAVQEKLVRWLVRELNGFDNLFYEIQNEPWADNHVMGDFINPYLADRRVFPNAVEITTAESVAWQATIARFIADEESRLPQRHLIAQNVANFRLALNEADLAPGADLVNFHYAYPEAAGWNRGLNRIVGYDETGFAGNADATYRRQAWNFVMSGGGLFNCLDYSFSVGREDGTDTANKAPGGGSPALRGQLRVLSSFVHGFDLALMRPDPNVVLASPGTVTRALSAPGKAYAIYLEGRAPAKLSLDVPRGKWRAEWINPLDGAVLHSETRIHNGGALNLTLEKFDSAVALRLVKQ
ncbi:MAG TPA: hypothetical protein PKA34_17260 [Blastocatellia bacterium]|nr:hypothetical protein [Blastocatellia bacterium]HMV84882.1 hypothetical protein [Blastocatellia bacterium]HNG33950.1 hypothetical protein [Blastocatellia bacterium]